MQLYCYIPSVYVSEPKSSAIVSLETIEKLEENLTTLRTKLVRHNCASGRGQQGRLLVDFMQDLCSINWVRFRLDLTYWTVFCLLYYTLCLGLYEILSVRLSYYFVSLGDFCARVSDFSLNYLTVIHYVFVCLYVVCTLFICTFTVCLHNCLSVFPAVSAFVSVCICSLTFCLYIDLLSSSCFQSPFLLTLFTQFRAKL